MSGATLHRYFFVVGFVGLILVLGVLAAPSRAQTVAATTTASWTGTRVSPTVSRTRTPSQTSTRLMSTRVSSRTMTPQADPAVAALISAALEKTMGLKAYDGYIEFKIGETVVERWVGRLNGDAAYFSYLSDYPSKNVEVILKEGKQYERTGNGERYGPWREIPRPQVKQNHFHVPTELFRQLVVEAGAYRKIGPTQLHDPCDTYIHELDGSISAALYEVSEKLGLPLNDQTTGGLEKASARLSICPDGYLHGAQIEFTPRKNWDAGHLIVGLSSLGPIPAINAPVITTPTRTRTLPPTPTPTLHPVLVAATVQAGVRGSEQPEQWNVVLADWNQENLHGWPEGQVQGDTGSFQFTITENKYRWEAHSTAGYLAQRTIRAVDPTDFYLTVDIQRVKGPRNAAYGIVFRAGPDGYYEFRVRDEPTGNGMSYFTLSRRGRDRDTVLIPEQSTLAVRKGEVNKLGILSQGDQISVSVNDQWMGSVRDNTLRAGRFGVFTQLFDAGDAEFEFANLELRVP